MAEYLMAELLSSDGPGRAKKCRELAVDARDHAAASHNLEMQQAFLQLVVQWDMLADEFERTWFPHERTTAA